MSQEACFLQTQFSPWVKHPGVLRVARQHHTPAPNTPHLAALWVLPRAVSTLTVSHPLLALEINVSGAKTVIS